MQLIKKRNKKKIIIGSLIALAGLAGIYAYIHYAKTNSIAPNINLNQPTQEQKNAGDTQKKQTILNSTSNSKETTGSDTLPTPTPSANGGKAVIGANITSSTQDSNTIHIRTLLQVITSTGTCTLTMSQLNQPTYTQTSGVQALSSSTTCKGFDIPASQLASGNWNIRLTFSNDKYSASTESTIEISH